MADGFQGVNIVSSRQTAIQRPIGWFGLSIVLADAPNLFISVQDSQNRAIRNCSVTVTNPSSGIVKSSNTDVDGNVALKADSINTITVVNNKVLKAYSYDRGAQGSQIVVLFDCPLIM